MKDIPTEISNYGYIQLLSKAQLYVLVHSQSALTHNVTSYSNFPRQHHAAIVQQVSN